jgi:oligopeptidase B
MKRPHTVLFGNVPGENRGDAKLMEPPISRNDDYFWIRDDKRQKPEVISLLNNENLKTNEVMDDTKQLQNDMFQEMKKRTLENETTYPYKFHSTDYMHYTKYIQDKGLPVYCRSCKLSGKEETLLNANDLSEGRAHCDIQEVTTSHDGKILSYGVDFQGNEEYEVILKNLETNELINHCIGKLLYAEYIWSPNNREIYYTDHDDAHRMCTINVYDIYTQKITCLYTENDQLFSVKIRNSDDLKSIFVTCESASTDEEYVIDPFDSTHCMKLIKKRENRIKYSVENYDDIHFIINTNANNMTNFGLMYCMKSKPDRWFELIQYNNEHYITNITLKQSFVVIEYRINGLTKIGYFQKKNITLDNLSIQFIEFKEAVHTVNVSEVHNLDYTSDEVIFYYESMTQPKKLMSVCMRNEERKVLYEKIVPNYDPSLYDSMLHLIPSHDGKEIPCSMSFKKESFMNGEKPQPLYLYGYGAYGHSIDPVFSNPFISLMDRGFIICLAHVRGGSEKGYDWYLDGKMKNKINTFKDYISCASYLIDNGFTNRNNLVAEGRSAGGLLMGSVLTMRPDLFKAMHLGVPFVDALVTMSDPSIPLTTPEWEEWGNPNIEEDFNCMSAYSPMDNIRKTDYPHTLITCGLSDPRVMYWEPTKFNLKLKDHATDNNLHLIKIDMDKGHFIAMDRYKSYAEKAFIYAFFIKSLLA